MAESTNNLAPINIEELSTFKLINSTDNLARLINFFLNILKHVIIAQIKHNNTVGIYHL